MSFAVDVALVPRKIGELFSDTESRASTLWVAGNGLIGPEAMSISAVTLADELIRQTRQEPSQDCIDRFLTAREIYSNNRFQTDLPFFIDACNLLAGESLNPNLFDPAEVDECAWGVLESEIIAGEVPIQYSPDVQTYVKQALRRENFLIPPKTLVPVVGKPTNDVFSSSVSDPSVYRSRMQDAAASAEDLDRRVEAEAQALAQEIRELKSILN